MFLNCWMDMLETFEGNLFHRLLYYIKYQNFCFKPFFPLSVQVIFKAPSSNSLILLKIRYV